MGKMMNMVCKEVENLEDKGALTSSNIEMAYKLVMMKEKLLRIEELEGKLGYSQDGAWTANGRYSRAGYPMDPYMMRMPMDPYEQSMRSGRYSMSMDDGRSMMGDRLQEMMSDPNLTQQERMALKKAMDSMAMR